MAEIQCPKCKGTGKARGVVTGRVASGTMLGDGTCDNCQGEGVLKPVVIVAEPAYISGKAQSSG